MAAYAAHTINQNTHLLTAKKNTTKNHTKEPTFRKRDVMGGKRQDNVSRAERDKTERATGLGRRTKEEIYIETWDQTGSPEISDMVETSEIPGLPSGVILCKRCGLWYSDCHVMSENPLEHQKVFLPNSRLSCPVPCIR